MKYCESCGMPMMSVSDFGGGKESSKYCILCVTEAGDLKSFEHKIEDLTLFVRNRLTVDDIEARTLAIESLLDMPAWKNMKAIYSCKTREKQLQF